MTGEETPPKEGAAVVRLPVRFRNPAPEDRSLVEPWETGKPSECRHQMVGYVVDEASDTVECGGCGARLNPMWVLTRLAREDRRWAESRKAAAEASKRLDEKRHTKCQHCQRMTRVRMPR